MWLVRNFVICVGASQCVACFDDSLLEACFDDLQFLTCLDDGSQFCDMFRAARFVV